PARPARPAASVPPRGPPRPATSACSAPAARSAPSRRPRRRPPGRPRRATTRAGPPPTTTGRPGRSRPPGALFGRSPPPPPARRRAPGTARASPARPPARRGSGRQAAQPFPAWNIQRCFSRSAVTAMRMSWLTGSASSVDVTRSRIRAITAPSASTSAPTAAVSSTQPSGVTPIPLPTATVAARPSGETPSAAARSATVSEWERATVTTSSSCRCTDRNRGPTTVQWICFATSDRSTRSTRAPCNAPDAVSRSASDNGLGPTYTPPSVGHPRVSPQRCPPHGVPANARRGTPRRPGARPRTHEGPGGTLPETSGRAPTGASWSVTPLGRAPPPSGGDDVHRFGGRLDGHPFRRHTGHRDGAEHRTHRRGDGLAGGRCSRLGQLGEGELVAHFPHELGHPYVQRVADGGEQLGGSLLLPPLHLGEIAE